MTNATHLRHSKFVAMHDNTDATRSSVEGLRGFVQSVDKLRH
jgi:hypothetical protein